jgi:VWFA-related protein
MAMRPIGAVAVCLALFAGASGLGGQEPADGQGQPFRAAVDVIEVDVSVLDKDRRPVRDLRQADFTVFEDGKAQTLVSFTQITAAEADPTRSARMSFVVRDVADNDLAERLANGRVFAIVLDDMNLPADDSDIVIATRDAARHIVDQLGPSDQASVVFAHEAGKTQDFTNNKAKLNEAIDRFLPNPPDYIAPRYQYQAGGGGDMPYRYSPLLAPSPCMRDQPAVPALDATVNALAAVPDRRKTLFFLSPGLPVNFVARDRCGEQRASIIKDVLRKAQRNNINLHGIDPAGYNGYRDYIEMYRIRNGRGAGVRRQPPGDIRLMHDFLKTIAENTGGRHVLDTDAVIGGIDRVFEEESSYYLIGYETSNGRPDGKFRKIDVKVNRPGVSVRNRAGYWGAEPDSVVARDRPASSINDFDPGLSGLTGPPGVALRAVAVALGPTGEPTTGSSPLADVVVALSVRWPALRAAVRETLNITRTVYDPEGRPGAPVRETVSLPLSPGDQLRHDVVRQVPLPAGRHQLRFNVASSLLNRNGTVYVDVEVPEFGRTALALSSIVLGTEPSETASGPSSLLPIVPTSARDFGNGEPVTAFVRVQQGGAAAPGPVSLTTEILDASDQVRFTETHAIEPAAFAADRGAGYRLRLPLERLQAGPHLLSVSARLANGRTARRDVLFRVR